MLDTRSEETICKSLNNGLYKEDFGKRKGKKLG